MITINPDNRFELEGRVTNIKEYAPGKAADITIAISNGKDSSGKTKDPTYLHTKCFTPAVYNTVVVGMKIHIFGHIGASKYEKDGQMIYGTDLVDDYIKFLESKSTVIAREASKAGDDYDF